MWGVEKENNLIYIKYKIDKFNNKLFIKTCNIAPPYFYYQLYLEYLTLLNYPV
jgi:hypothetical protein